MAILVVFAAFPLFSMVHTGLGIQCLKESLCQSDRPHPVPARPRAGRQGLPNDKGGIHRAVTVQIGSVLTRPDLFCNCSVQNCFWTDQTGAVRFVYACPTFPGSVKPDQTSIGFVGPVLVLYGKPDEIGSVPLGAV